jgi:DNA modification methylase
MHTEHKIILGNSQTMPELQNDSVQLMVTSPPYPMIKMWDSIFAKADPRIAELWQKLEADGKEETVGQIYDAMDDRLP